MDKVVVGMIPQSRIRTTNSPYTDRYEFLDLYTKRILECGGLPIGLIANNGRIPQDYLELCDTFFFPGGIKFEKYHFDTLNYAINNDKPLLGVCLGMQAIGVYSDVMQYVDNYSEEEFFKAYRYLKSQYDNSILKVMEEPGMHNKVELTYANSDLARHEVKITDSKSILYDIYKKYLIDVVSLHKTTLKRIGETFKETAISSDGVIESIEIKDPDRFVMGVQWHPEWDDDNALIRRLVKEGEKRKHGR